MAIKTGSKVFAALSTGLAGNTHSATSFWWNSTGRDLAAMLSVAKYPEDAQIGFLSFYRDHICPKFGTPPTSSSIKSGMTYDGTPIEYSYSFNSTTKLPAVRFVVDINPLREPTAENPPLSTKGMENAIKEFMARNKKADDTWYHGLKRYFDVTSDPAKVTGLINQAGHQSPEMFGFDIDRKISPPSGKGLPDVPATGKLYFLPCLSAAERGITR